MFRLRHLGFGTWSDDEQSCNTTPSKHLGSGTHAQVPKLATNNLGIPWYLSACAQVREIPELATSNLRKPGCLIAWAEILGLWYPGWRWTVLRWQTILWLRLMYLGLRAKVCDERAWNTKPIISGRKQQSLNASVVLGARTISYVLPTAPSTPMISTPWPRKTKKHQEYEGLLFPLSFRSTSQTATRWQQKNTLTLYVCPPAHRSWQDVTSVMEHESTPNPENMLKKLKHYRAWASESR